MNSHKTKTDACFFRHPYCWRFKNLFNQNWHLAHQCYKIFVLYFFLFISNHYKLLINGIQLCFAWTISQQFKSVLQRCAATSGGQQN
jgi:hypothetical protein